MNEPDWHEITHDFVRLYKTLRRLERSIGKILDEYDKRYGIGGENELQLSENVGERR